MFKNFLMLIQFMTRIPVPLKLEYNEGKIQRAFKLFPLLGLLIALILLAVYWMTNRIIDNKLIVAMFVLIAEIIISGGLHLDGLADSFDGLFSYRSKEKMLEIMKDSRIGTNGVLILIITILLKVFLIAEINWEYLVLMPVFSRLSSVINAGIGNYARENGMAKILVDKTGKKDILISTILSGVIGYLFIGEYVFILLGIISIFSILFLRICEKKIGGVTGDTLGAVLELSSVLVLIVGCVLK